MLKPARFAEFWPASGSEGEEAEPSRSGAKRIECRHVERHKIPPVPGYDGKAVRQRGRGDQGVLEEILRPGMEQLGRNPKNMGVDRNDAIRIRDAVHPPFDFAGLIRIAGPRRLHARLQFIKGHRREVQLRFLNRSQPRNYGAMRPCSSELGDDVGIQKKHRSIEGDRLAVLAAATRGGQFESRFLGQEQLL